MRLVVVESLRRGNRGVEFDVQTPTIFTIVGEDVLGGTHAVAVSMVYVYGAAIGGRGISFERADCHYIAGNHRRTSASEVS